MTREDINDIINAICPNDEDYEKPCISPKYLRQELEQLALDQRQWNEEPTIEIDLISRKAVLNLPKRKLRNYFGEVTADVINVKDIMDMPSITLQEPKTGHWIDRDVYDADRWKCSECGRTEQYQENFCPNCGAKMKEVEE